MLSSTGSYTIWCCIHARRISGDNNQGLLVFLVDGSHGDMTDPHESQFSIITATGKRMKFRSDLLDASRVSEQEPSLSKRAALAIHRMVIPGSLDVCDEDLPAFVVKGEVEIAVCKVPVRLEICFDSLLEDPGHQREVQFMLSWDLPLGEDSHQWLHDQAMGDVFCEGDTMPAILMSQSGERQVICRLDRSLGNGVYDAQLLSWEGPPLDIEDGMTLVRRATWIQPSPIYRREFPCKIEATFAVVKQINASRPVPK